MVLRLEYADLMLCEIPLVKAQFVMLVFYLVGDLMEQADT
jgi:hypothetical protein